MNTKPVSRRRFAGALAATIGYLGLRPGGDLLAHHVDPATLSAAGRVPPNEYDALVKLCFNENPYGPPKSVMEAMSSALKYANRYAYPDNNIIQAIAEHHAVKPENVLIASGSTEILEIATAAFLEGGKKVVGVEPTFGSVYEWAIGLKCGAIRLPLRADFRQDIPAMIQAAKESPKEVGLVYLCNPNNPTGAIVTKDEVRQLLDGLPEGMPVLIDEAYHHFVTTPLTPRPFPMWPRAGPC